jgi:hypothetical protein
LNGVVSSSPFSELANGVSHLPKFSIETTPKVWMHFATATEIGCGQTIFTSMSAGAEPLRRHGGECFGKAVVSFAPTSASGCTNEAFAANDADAAIGDRRKSSSAGVP